MVKLSGVKTTSAQSLPTNAVHAGAEPARTEHVQPSGWVAGDNMAVKAWAYLGMNRTFDVSASRTMNDIMQQRYGRQDPKRLANDLDAGLRENFGAQPTQANSHDQLIAFLVANPRCTFAALAAELTRLYTPKSVATTAR